MINPSARLDVNLLAGAGGIELWDLAQPADAAPRKLASKLASFQSLAFSADGRWLAAGAALGAELFDLADAEQSSAARQVPGVRWNMLVSHVAFSHDDRCLITVGGAGHVRLWDMRAADPTAAPRALAENTSGARHAMTGADGRTLVVVGGDNAIRLWDLAAADPSSTVNTLRGQEGTASDVLLTSSGRSLVAGPRVLRRWNLPAPTMGDEGFSMRVAASRWLQPRFRLCDVESSDPTSSFLDLTGHTSEDETLAVDRLGQRLASTSRDGSLRVWNLADMPERITSIALRPHDAPDDHLTISPNGRWTAVGGEQQFSVQLWDLNGADDLDALRPRRSVHRRAAAWVARLDVVLDAGAARQIRGAKSTGPRRAVAPELSERSSNSPRLNSRVDVRRRARRPARNGAESSFALAGRRVQDGAAARARNEST